MFECVVVFVEGEGRKVGGGEGEGGVGRRERGWGGGLTKL